VKLGAVFAGDSGEVGGVQDAVLALGEVAGVTIDVLLVEVIFGHQGAVGTAL
jgi:hypothetical protein